MKNIVWTKPDNTTAFTSLPSNSNLISEDVAADMLQNQQVPSDWIASDFDVESAPVSIDDLIAAKHTDINQKFNSAIQQIIAGIPANEISSWDKQEAEARAYTADANAVTPLLDALATARGITKADLADRIITKADLFATVSGQLIGTRQGLEDQLDVLAEDENATAEDIAAVVWPS